MGAVAVTERAIASAGADLTFVQWRVLLIVGEHAGGATVGEIASRIGANESPASRLVSRLKRRGVVSTERDATDGRVTRVRLTEAGEAMRTQVLDHRRRDLAAVAAARPMTPAEVGMVARLARSFDPFR